MKIFQPLIRALSALVFITSLMVFFLVHKDVDNEKAILDLLWANMMFQIIISWKD